MRICPVCGGKQFIVKAHVVQEWLVNKCGLCEKVIDDCICITHEPDNEDLWFCNSCGHKAAGKEFWVDEELVKE